jgi:thiol-disulfide isomerase/thioredoxin
MPTKQKSKRNVVRKTKRAKKADSLDVISDQDLAKLSDLLKKHKVVVVLVHADWCGHCQTFKPLWEEYKKISGRNVPMVSVNETMLPKTPFKDAKLDGYPSTLVYSGKDGSFGSFKNEKGQETNAVPNSRDKEVMSKILKASPSMMRRENNANSETAHSTPEAEMLRNISGKKAMREKDIPMLNINIVKPPNTNSDIVANNIPVSRRARRTEKAAY